MGFGSSAEAEQHFEVVIKTVLSFLLSMLVGEYLAIEQDFGDAFLPELWDCDVVVKRTETWVTSTAALVASIAY